jgi:diacylglycerol kinase family enzyme
VLAQLVTGRAVPHGRQVVRWHDLPDLSLHATLAQPFQVDGDYLGQRYQVRLSSCPKALRALC